VTEAFTEVAQFRVDPGHVRAHAEGWQSWTPARPYAPGDRRRGPADQRLLDHFWRSGTSYALEEGTRQADGGLLAVDPGLGGEDVVVCAAPDPGRIPVIRAVLRGGACVVTADGPCVVQRFPGTLDEALAAWAAGWPGTWGEQWRQGGAQWTARDQQEPGTAWCTWYGLRRRFSYDSLETAMDVIEREHLPVSTVQVDDGFAAVLGDWRSSVRPDLGSLEQVAARISDRGFRAGLWLCPTLADVTSDVVARYPGLWVPGVDMPFGSARRVRILDPTSPAGAEYLEGLVRDIAGAGFGHWLKLDFLWTGAVPGRRASGADPVGAYRLALRIIRGAAGPCTRLIGSGAPLLASVDAGLTAVRTSPDVGPVWEPPGGDLSQPAGRSAVETGRARRYLAALLRPDPDVLMAGPEVQHREEIAAHVDALPANLRVSGDRLDTLDERGLELTRRVLGTRA